MSHYEYTLSVSVKSTETSHLDGLKPKPIGLMMVIPVPTSEEQMSDSI